eukprot:COSAG02_NODE_4820_length_4939_cov_9.921074_1_plen_84_part_00
MCVAGNAWVLHRNESVNLGSGSESWLQFANCCRIRTNYGTGSIRCCTIQRYFDEIASFELTARMRTRRYYRRGRLGETVDYHS